MLDAGSLLMRRTADLANDLAVFAATLDLTLRHAQ
jgi:hypothetical protein